MYGDEKYALLDPERTQIMIAFDLEGSDTAVFKDHYVRHRTPVLAMCRKLVQNGYSDDDVTVYRGSTPCLAGRLHKMADLTIVEEPHLRLAKYQKFEGIGNS